MEADAAGSAHDDGSAKRFASTAVLTEPVGVSTAPEPPPDAPAPFPRLHAAPIGRRVMTGERPRSRCVVPAATTDRTPDTPPDR
jgi:hypothetical protein